MAETRLKTQQAISGDGWSPADETWTYASASTITVPSGAASKYAVGDRIKWTQTTVKYGVIVAVADTLLTIAVNTDYTVANAAISANFYSHQMSPIGYPHWFNYSPSVTWDGTPPSTATLVAKYCVNGRACTTVVSQVNTSAGTSNTSALVALPISGAVTGSVFTTASSGTLSTTPGNDTAGWTAVKGCVIYNGVDIRVYVASGISAKSVFVSSTYQI